MTAPVSDIESLFIADDTQDEAAEKIADGVAGDPVRH